MTSTTRRMAAVLVTSAAVACSTLTLATPADAAGRHFGDVATYYKATLESWKVSTDGGAKWKVFLRLDNTANKRRNERSGALLVVRDGQMTNRRIDTGYVAGGKVSAVKSIDVPKGSRYSLNMGVGAGQMGDGGPVALADLRKC